jgi:hypothetical protein
MQAHLSNGAKFRAKRTERHPRLLRSPSLWLLVEAILEEVEAVVVGEVVQVVVGLSAAVVGVHPEAVQLLAQTILPWPA